ncbi:MAG: glycosyltransferase family 2 protein [Paludibacteraceae bacterium]|nr:glycosyltransferase family 2 protein [Paludibacteraceae bacterium]
MKKVFVIIVTYQGKQWYDHCFTSLSKSTLPVQVVVVDNTPGNEDAVYIKSHYPEIHLIKPEENLGFGRANNLGMHYALDHGCDYVFLLNQDAWIESDSIERLVAIAEKHPEFGILSPMQMTKEKDHLNILVDDGKQNYELLSDAYCGNLKEYYLVKYVNAAAWLLPRNTLEIVGGFDPIFKHYEEDDDYLNRAIYHKLGIAFCPKIQVVHDHTTLRNPFEQTVSRHQQFLLLDHVDINKPEHIHSHMRYLLRKTMVSALRLKMKDCRAYYADYKYLRKMRSAILNSRKQNVKKFANWL